MKRKQKRKHLEKNSSPPSAKKSRDSKKLTPVLEPSVLTQGHGHTTQDYSENIFSNFSSDKVTNKELPEPEVQVKEVVPEPPAVAPAWTQTTGGNSLASENFNYVSSSRNLILTDEHEVKNPQEVAPEPHMLAFVWTQTAGENSSASEYLTCVSCARKLIPICEHGFQMFQQIAPAPCRMNWIQVPGETSTSGEYTKCALSASKNISTDNDAKAYEFQKWKKIATEKYELETSRTQVAGKFLSDSEYFTSLYTTRTFLPTEEHDFQEFNETANEPYVLEASRTQAAGENAENFTSLSITRQLLPTEEYDFENKEESSIEPHILEAASAWAARENSFDLEYCTFFSTASKLHLTNEHDFQKCNDIATEPHVLEVTSTQVAENNSSESENFTRTSATNKLLSTEEHDFQKWKRIAIKRYMLETARNLAAGDHSSDSEYFTCFSTLSKPIPTEEYDFQSFKEAAIAPHKQEAAGENSSDSEYFTCLSTTRKLLSTEKHGFQKFQEVASAQCRVTYTQTAGEKSSSSQYLTCVSSPTKHTAIDEEGLQKCQEIASESHMLDLVRDQAPEDNSSSSEYFTCVSSDGELVPIDKHETSELHSCVPYPETRRMPLVHKLEESECSLPLAYNEFPVYMANDPCTLSMPKKRERVMKVYYMHVRMKRGVAALEETNEGQPSRKKTKMETIAFPETIHTEEKLSHISTRELLTESDLSLDDTAQEAPEEDDIPMDPPPLETCSRARTPEWLVARDSGYRCMACCRVFASLEILQDHVQNGVKEGFSCHSFHLALDWLRSKKANGKKKCTKRRKIKPKRAGYKGKQYKKTTSPCT